MTQPPSKDLLTKRLRLIQAAGCYVELALLAGTWIPTAMEAQIEGKGVSIKLVERDRKGTSQYGRYTKGVRPRKETHSAVEKKYPESNLRYWYYHPRRIAR